MLVRLKRMLLPITVFIVIVAFSSFRMAGKTGTPPIFAGVAFEQAEARAEREDKPLVVDASAGWCGPCKRMDRDTWRDDELTAWMSRHAVPVQFDVDKEPELAERFGVSQLPTVFVLRRGQEVAKRTGFAPANEMLAWLQLHAGRPDP